MKTYSVTAKRVGGWWEVTIPDANDGVTQGRTLAEAKTMAVSYISLMLGDQEGSFEVDLHVDLGAAGQELQAARERAAAAEAEQVSAAAAIRTVVQHLNRTEKVSGQDLAALVGVSKQRISQLLSQSDTTGQQRTAQPKARTPRQRSRAGT